MPRAEFGSGPRGRELQAVPCVVPSTSGIDLPASGHEYPSREA